MFTACPLSVPSLVNELIAKQIIPALDEAQPAALTEYLFKRANTPLRLQVAEIAYRNHGHPQALDLFLACTMPLAQKWSERKAHRLFVYPSDWQLECFYNGAVSALLGMFQHHAALKCMPDAFRRYLLHSMAWGALQAYFKRDEYCRMTTVKNVELIAPPRPPSDNPVEQALITRDLLEQIAHYPLLGRALSKTLQCIAELGPDGALKERASKKGNAENWKNIRGLRPMLNPQAIAEVRGIKPSVVLNQLHMARAVLRKAFNDDGRLFQTH